MIFVVYQYIYIMKKTFTLLALLFFGYTQGQNINTIAGDGTSGFSGDGGPATSSVLKNPTGVAVDAQGNIYIADSFNGRVRKIDASTGNITTVAGSGMYGFSGDGGPATAAKMKYPTDVAIDSQGNLYISGNTDYRIRKVTASTGIITTIAGDGTSNNTGDGGLATAAQLSAGQMAFDSQDNLYISSGNTVRKITASTGIITTVAGTGPTGFSGDGGPATAATFNTIGGLVIDGNGNIYIADQGNNRVRKVDASTGIINTIVSQSGSGPYGLALDIQGNLYIADQTDHRIRKLDAVTSAITVIAGNGNSNFSGDGGPATAAELYFPGDLAIDSQNNIYLTEGYSSLPIKDYRVREISSGMASGIEQLANNKEQIIIYPNPSTGVFNYASSAVFSEIKIYNVLGKLVDMKKINSNEFSIDLTNQEKGIYFYQITDEHKNTKSGKIILE